MNRICIAALMTVMICVSGCGPEAKKPSGRTKNSIETKIGSEAYEATIKLVNFDYTNRDTGPDVMRKLISDGALVNSRGDGFNSLSKAAVTSSLEIVTLLIEAGADVNFKNADGSFPLLFALVTGNLRIVKLLIEAGADVNAKDKDGRTPLSLTDNSEIIKILKAAGARE
jgi:ankyrin repeat protein